MSLQILVSTMHQTNYDLLNSINVCADAVVINQCDENSMKEFDKNGHLIKWINTTERGLSNSRNKAIENATADICLLVDDDEELIESNIKQIEDIFKKNESVSVFRFKICGIEHEYKSYPYLQKKLNFFTAMKISSVEIAFKRKDVADINFNTLLGAGAKYYTGEENVFISQCFKNKLKVCFYPLTIANLHIDNESTWFEGFNKKYFISNGAMFAAMSTRFSSFLIFQFAIRHKKLFNQIGFLKGLRFMFEGRKTYLLDIKNKIKLQ